MAVCNLSDLVTQACANGFHCLPPNVGDAIELQLWKSFGADDSTLAVLLEQAAANGFLNAAQMPDLSDSLELQLLCDLGG